LLLPQPPLRPSNTAPRTPGRGISFASREETSRWDDSPVASPRAPFPDDSGMIVLQGWRGPCRLPPRINLHATVSTGRTSLLGRVRIPTTDAPPARPPPSRLSPRPPKSSALNGRLPLQRRGGVILLVMHTTGTPSLFHRPCREHALPAAVGGRRRLSPARVVQVQVPASFGSACCGCQLRSLSSCSVVDLTFSDHAHVGWVVQGQTHQARNGKDQSVLSHRALGLCNAGWPSSAGLMFCRLGRT
jgi:hypothetical protein